MTSPHEPVVRPTGARGASPDAARQSRRTRRIEIVATVLLSAATVLTAWSAFQATKWSGVQAIAFSQASASRTESVRASTAAGQQSVADVSVFTAWLTATDQGQTRLADLLATRFRGELKVAFRAWEATDPFTNPSAHNTCRTLWPSPASGAAAVPYPVGVPLPPRGSPGHPVRYCRPSCRQRVDEARRLMAKATGRYFSVGGRPTVGGRRTHGAGQEGLESLAQAQDEPAYSVR